MKHLFSKSSNTSSALSITLPATKLLCDSRFWTEGGKKNPMFFPKSVFDQHSYLIHDISFSSLFFSASSNTRKFYIQTSEELDVSLFLPVSLYCSAFNKVSPVTTYGYFEGEPCPDFSQNSMGISISTDAWLTYIEKHLSDESSITL